MHFLSDFETVSQDILERNACRNPGPSGPGETSYQLGSSVLAVGESPAVQAGVLQ